MKALASHSPVIHTRWEPGTQRGSAHYRTIPTLQEYVLLSQDRIMVERFVRHGDVRHLAEFSGTEAVLPLESLGCGIPLARVYRVLEPGQDDPG